MFTTSNNKWSSYLDFLREVCHEITNTRDISLLFHFAGITEVMMIIKMMLVVAVFVVKFTRVRSLPGFVSNSRTPVKYAWPMWLWLMKMPTQKLFFWWVVLKIDHIDYKVGAYFDLPPALIRDIIEIKWTAIIFIIAWYKSSQLFVFPITSTNDCRPIPDVYLIPLWHVSLGKPW